MEEFCNNPWSFVLGVLFVDSKIHKLNWPTPKISFKIFPSALNEGKCHVNITFSLKNLQSDKQEMKILL